jgi:hypothetical protein
MARMGLSIECPTMAKATNKAITENSLNEYAF